MENKFLYRSILKNKDVPKLSLMGVVCELTLSKELFPKNLDIDYLLDTVFHVKFKEYVMKSRTTILARLVRIIDVSSDKEFQMYKRNLLKFIEQYYYMEQSDSKNSKSPISKWVTKE